MEYRELTSAQKIFFGNTQTFQNSMWNQGYYIQFNEKYSYDRINSVLNSFMEKNDGVRVRVTTMDNVPYSYIVDYEETTFEYKIFTSKDLLDDFVNIDLEKEFHLDSELFRCYICEIGEFSGILFIAHHLLCDGGSVLSLSSIIAALTKDEDINSYSYRTHLLKELEYLNTNKRVNDKKYWEKLFLATPKTLLYSKKDYSLNYDGGKAKCTITKQTADLIRNFCKQNQITIQSFFNTIFGIYFWNNQGAEPFTIGVPLSNRVSNNDIKTFGLFVQVVPLVIDFQADTFIDNAKKVYDTLLSMFRHYNYSSYDISNELLNNHKVYDVVLEYHYQYKTHEFLVETYFSNKVSTALDVHIEDSVTEEIIILCRYREQFFNREQIEKLTEEIVRLIEDAIREPNISIKALSLQPTSNQRKSALLGETIDIPEINIFNWFSSNAEKKRNQICIVSNERELKYGDLLILVRNIVFSLKSVGASANDKIIVIAERSIEMYAAIYGILGLGACYIPVDVTCPEERLRYIVKDATAKFILAQKKYADNVTTDIGSQIIIIEDCLANKEGTQELIVSPSSSNDLAYIIYTSGTTGVPKGVMISHKSLVNRLQWMQRAYPLLFTDSILQKTPYTFDVSVWELFWWAICGARMFVLPPKDHYNMSKTVSAIYQGEITHIHFVPSVYEIFINYIKANPSELIKVQTLKHIFLSGEVLDKRSVADMKKLLPDVKQHNLYGPTECTIDVTFYDCNSDCDDVIPIGVPIDNTQIYIIDDDKKLLPQGERGELCIAGANVGEGYLNLPELTLQKFISNPFGTGKMYLSGDVAYINDDFQIVFCGRKDQQVKLFGQRIELDEIEEILLQYPTVEKATVIIKNEGISPKIIAFYTGTKEDKGVLVGFLKTKLPRYMVPTFIYHISQIPLTSHGKIDRKKLIEIADSIEKNEISQPQNMLEKQLCELFADQLGQQSYSRNESFLDAGGSSLDVMSVLSSELLDNINIDEFCMHPSPAELSSYMLGKKKATTALIPISISASDKRSMILCPYAGGGILSFNTFVRKLKEKLPDTSFYYLGWETNIQQAAKEIIEIAEHSEVVIYAHCAGVSLALSVFEEARKLEFDVKNISFFVGGMILPRRAFPAINPWGFITNSMLKRMLIKAGMSGKVVSSKIIDEIISNFRSNVKRHFYILNHFKAQIDCPTTIVIAQNDIFTRNFKSAKKRWANYVSNTLTVKIIDETSHYFLEDSESALYDIIIQKLEQGDDKI